MQYDFDPADCGSNDNCGLFREIDVAALFARLTIKEAAMESFVYGQNTSRFRDLLLRVTDADQRQQIRQLLAEEEARALPRKLGPPPE